MMQILCRSVSCLSLLTVFKVHVDSACRSEYEMPTLPPMICNHTKNDNKLGNKVRMEVPYMNKTSRDDSLQVDIPTSFMKSSL